MKRKRIYAESTMNSLRKPISLVVEPVAELEDSFIQGVIAFKEALSQKISPNDALKRIFSHTRCFAELDYKLQEHKLGNIPSNVNTFLVYKDMSVAIHKINQSQARLTSKQRKKVIGSIALSVEHAFMLLVYMAGSEISLGQARVDSLLKEMYIPLHRYGYNVVMENIIDDAQRNNIWIQRNSLKD